MQQAARVSDYTAYMYLGELIEFDVTDTIFIKPTPQADRGLHHRPFWLESSFLRRCSGAASFSHAGPAGRGDCGFLIAFNALLRCISVSPRLTLPGASL